MSMFSRRVGHSLRLLPLLCAATLSAASVPESAREIPVAHDVDVVVVGGTSAGVCAAVAAAQAGAKVFLAAPRPYLGEDLCATYRLWLELGEIPKTPLAKAMFLRPDMDRGMDFTYKTSLPSVDRHQDTDPPRMLNDGCWQSGFNQSVQYDGEVVIDVDLGKIAPLHEIRAMIFQSTGNFDIPRIEVSASTDGNAYTALTTLTNREFGKGAYVTKPLELRSVVKGRARHLRFAVRKGPKASRVLIGELRIFEQKTKSALPPGVIMATPMAIKLALDGALLKAGVPFLYGCYATDVLRDPDGNLAGIVMANRAGRQAVRAKVVIDATHRADLARLAGAPFRPYPAGAHTFHRVVIGGAVRFADQMSCQRIRVRKPIGAKLDVRFGTPGGGFANTVNRVNAPMTRSYDEIFDYTLRLRLPDASFASFAEAEQEARDLTFHPEQVEESEMLFEIPPDPVHGMASATGAWTGADSADLDVCRPKGMSRLYVLGACADISRKAAAKLLRPLESMRLGTRIGTAAAEEAKTVKRAPVATVAGTPSVGAVKGVVGETLLGIRSMGKPDTTLSSATRALPVLGEYDVVVLGGGTSGAPAGIGAARQGAKTLVIDYLHGLGGVGTTGLIGLYCAGYRKGFTAEIDRGIIALGCPSYIVGKQEYWRRENRKAGADIWFGVLGCGSYRIGAKIRGVVVATPQGRGVVLAKVVIDGTGNADVAAAAGAETIHSSAAHPAMQGTGIPYRPPGASYVNTDWTYVDDSDMLDVWSALVTARQRYPQSYDLGQLIDTRERRRIVGDYILSPLDIINRRRFPDTIQISQGGKLDTHGITIHPYYMINNYYGGNAYTPYRCLLPKGLDGILVVGLAVSAHRDAIPSIRMQPGMQNLGYAAGVAAAMAAKQNLPTRDIDVGKLQRHLVAKQCLTPDVPSHKDSYPLPAATVQAAVDQLAGKDYKKLSIIMSQPETVLPMLRTAWKEAADPEAKLRIAHVLGIMGDPAGLETLLAAIEGMKEFDDENISRYFPCITWLDSYIIAAGFTRDAQAVPTLMEKLELAKSTRPRRWSHYRALCIAFERIGAETPVKTLTEIFKQSGMAGSPAIPVKGVEKLFRGKGGLRALVVARTLYNLGDPEGVAEKALRAFSGDVRGHYARHARAVLAQPKGNALR
ncbi:MAG: FAD-dependent oxidoreductase [Lentisphaeria bacterium]|nr:FAD-dependent oxidoreductase [Lentisphaeria bacterium]